MRKVSDTIQRESVYGTRERSSLLAVGRLTASTRSVSRRTSSYRSVRDLPGIMRVSTAIARRVPRPIRVRAESRPMARLRSARTKPLPVSRTRVPRLGADLAEISFPVCRKRCVRRRSEPPTSLDEAVRMLMNHIESGKVCACGASWLSVRTLEPKFRLVN
jgi:hypothetical protein